MNPNLRTALFVSGWVIGIISFGLAIFLAFRNEALMRENALNQAQFVRTINSLVLANVKQADFLIDIVEDIQQTQAKLVETVNSYSVHAEPIQQALNDVSIKIAKLHDRSFRNRYYALNSPLAHSYRTEKMNN